MIVITYYYIKETPPENRKIPGIVAGIIDSMIIYSALYLLSMVL